MKFFRSFGIISCLLVTLCLFLMLSTRAVYTFNTSNGNVVYYYGQDVLYVYSTVSYSTGIISRHEPSAGALCAFICLSMAVTMLAIGALLPLIKNERSFNVFSGILNLLSMLLILIAAISILFVPTDWSYFSDVTRNDSIRFGLGGGYTAATIISFFAAILCLPSIITCLKR